MVAGAFNPSTWEAEAGGCLGVRGQPGLQELIPGQAPKLQRNPVSKNQTKKKKTEERGKPPHLLMFGDHGMRIPNH